MMKQTNYRKTIILGSLVTLLPMLIGMILWQKLPQTLATHFNNNQPNGWTSKTFTVYGLPVLLLLLEWFIAIMIYYSLKKHPVKSKVIALTLWLVPITSVSVICSFYVIGLGYRVNMSFFLSILAGLVYIVLGNYLPKSQPNGVVGVRLPWTKNDKDNWQKTNRLSGWTFVIGGLILLVTSFMQIDWIILLVVLGAVLIPTVYSYVLSKRTN